MPRPRQLLPVCLVAAALAVACGVQDSGNGGVSAPRANLLFIAVDTLRADHLGGYGYERPTSPAVDALFERAVVFEDAQASTSWTLPSLASAMTGVYPSTHRCFSFRSRLDDSYATLAELLRAAGWTTGGIVSHVFLGERYGLHQGFDDYDQELVKADAEASHEQISSERISDKALAWLAARAAAPTDEPWFLFAHYFDPHGVYNAHPGVSEAFGTEEDLDLYDGEIAFTDRHLARLLSGLEEHGFAENTVVVFVADHGEEFGDHGLAKHGKTLHQEVLRVPLAIAVPGTAPRRVSQTVRVVDLAPTLLELLRVPPPPLALAGRSLVPLLDGDSLEPRGALAELRLRAEYQADAYVTERWKLIVDRNPEHVEVRPGMKLTPAFRLYDRASDPHEQHDVAAEHPEVVEELREALKLEVRAARELGATYREAREIEHTPEELDELRKLGYGG